MLDIIFKFLLALCGLILSYLFFLKVRLHYEVKRGLRAWCLAHGCVFIGYNNVRAFKDCGSIKAALSTVNYEVTCSDSAGQESVMQVVVEFNPVTAKLLRIEEGIWLSG